MTHRFTGDEDPRFLRSVARYRAVKGTIELGKDLAEWDLPAAINRLVAVNLYLVLGQEPQAPEVEP